LLVDKVIHYLQQLAISHSLSPLVKLIDSVFI
jgi:hypothetical protein